MKGLYSFELPRSGYKQHPSPNMPGKISGRRVTGNLSGLAGVFGEDEEL